MRDRYGFDFRNPRQYAFVLSFADCRRDAWRCRRFDICTIVRKKNCLACAGADDAKRGGAGYEISRIVAARRNNENCFVEKWNFVF